MQNLCHSYALELLKFREAGVEVILKASFWNPFELDHKLIKMGNEKET